MNSCYHSINMAKNTVIDEEELFSNLYYDFLYNSPEIEKIIFKYKNNLYIKYPKIENRKKLFEIKYEKRILFQDELNLLLIDINESLVSKIKRLPFKLQIA